MLQASFNDGFRAAEQAIFPLVSQGKPIDISIATCPEREHFKTVLNHYEFIAQGIRNGDIDEQMVIDSLRSSILTLYERVEEGVFKLRTNRRRQTLYEHLEWLHCRWEVRRPGFIKRLFEGLMGRPFGGQRKKPTV